MIDPRLISLPSAAYPWSVPPRRAFPGGKEARHVVHGPDING
jgi:hypothetical protein